MAITFNLSVENKTLKVIASGKDDSYEDVTNYLKAVIETATKHLCTAVFCDERNLEYSLSTIDTYRLAEEASKKASSTARVAIVCNKKYIEEGKFYETVASNRGLRVFVTSDYELAITWLNNK